MHQFPSKPAPLRGEKARSSARQETFRVHEFKPLPESSQAFCEVLYIDALAPATQLLDTALQRLRALGGLLDLLEDHPAASASQWDLARWSTTLRMLHADAQALLEAAHQRTLEELPG